MVQSTVSNGLQQRVLARRRFAAPPGRGPQRGRPALDGERSPRLAPCPLALADVPLTDQLAPASGTVRQSIQFRDPH